MDSITLEYLRKKKGRSKKDMATAIEKTENSYSKKERGEVSFSDKEKVIIAKDLEMTMEQVGAVFFDGELPKW